jgi:hypothetical protein
LWQLIIKFVHTSTTIGSPCNMCETTKWHAPMTICSNLMEKTKGGRTWKGRTVVSKRLKWTPNICATNNYQDLPKTNNDWHRHPYHTIHPP